MNKIIKRAALTLGALALCLCCGLTARAEGPIRAEIPVEIDLSGPVPQEAEVFTLELTAWEQCPLPQGALDGCYRMELAGKTPGKLVLEFDSPGVYRYHLRQIGGSRADCSYDAREYEITTYVTNSELGGYEVSVVVNQSQQAGKQRTISFVNRYAAPASVTLTARKTLDGKTPEDGAFAFELVDDRGNVVQTVKNVGQDVTFSPLSWTEEGIYHLQIREKPGTDDTITYDGTIYDVEVSVTLDGDYIPCVSYAKNGSVWEGPAAFANYTKSPESVVPKTGDEFQMFLWMSALVGSLGALMVLLRKRKG